MAAGTVQQKDQLTKAETVALWHAVSNFELLVKQMDQVEGVTQEQISAERDRLTTAKRALRKVNKLREQWKSAMTNVSSHEAMVRGQAITRGRGTSAEDVPRTAYGYKQQPLTLNMLLSLHHLLAGRKNPKYRAFYMGYWGLLQRGLVTGRQEVTELGRKVAMENASVMAQFSAGKIPSQIVR